MRASELAERFEVTTRTIERDLLALQEAGVPMCFGIKDPTGQIHYIFQFAQARPSRAVA